MDQNEKYQYNFQYSLANYHSIQEEESDNDEQFSSKDEQIILRRSDELIFFRCFNDKKAEQSIKGIFSFYLTLYGRVAVRLFRICEKIYLNMDMSSSSFIRNFQEVIDYERQKLVENLKQLTNTFKNEKETILKLISLCVSSAIFKILTLEKELNDLDFQTVFHTVFWEITGMHSTSQFLKKMLSETFNGVNFHNYLINQTPTKICMAQSVTHSFGKKSIQICNSVQFNDQISFSIKGPSAKRFTENLKEKEGISFSKTIKKKEKINKENEFSLINQNQYHTVQGPSHSIVQNKNFENPSQVNLSSNKKTFNFKKDRTTFFENYSKSKSTKKMVDDFNSGTKKPIFTDYLQQKRLNF